MGRKEVVAELQARIRRLRRIEYLLTTAKYKEACSLAEDTSGLEAAILEEDDLKVRLWIIRNAPVEETFEDLRTRAKHLGVVNYSRLTKCRLIAEVERLEREKRRTDR